MKSFFTISIAAINNGLLLAQTTTTPTDEFNLKGYIETAIIIFAIFLAIGAWFALSFATDKEKEKKFYGAILFSLNWIKNKISGLVPLEKENELMMKENYDGIKELNNSIPPWFNILFYGTIIFALIYMIDFHVLKTSPLQEEEFKTEVTAAKYEKELLIKSGKLLTEATVVQLKDIGALSSGKETFISKCSVCHGRFGEGLVGPNLTDNYWIHGNTVQNIFKVIRIGVPAKGMISWESQLSPQQIQEVASYILTLQGTNPPNGKKPEGQEIKPGIDSLKVAI
jgi:cytochrome c oxidase cbb3-type subunit 3